MSDDSKIDLISNYLPITRQPGMLGVLCGRCPRLDGQPYADQFNDLMSGQITQLPHATYRLFDNFLKAHSKLDIVRINEEFTVFLKSIKNLKATKDGLFLSYNFKTSDPMFMVIDFLKNRIEEVESYEDIELCTQEINTLLHEVTLTVKVTNDRFKHEYIVKGLALSSLEIFDGEGADMISLVDYYKRYYDVTVQYPNLPCLELGLPSKPDSSTWAPIEFCHVTTQGPNKEVIGRSKETRLSHPADRLTKIRRMALAEFPLSNLLHSFDLQVEPEVKRVAGKVLRPPDLLLGTLKQGLQSIEIGEQIDKWDYGTLLSCSSNKHTVCSGKHLRKWVLIRFVHEQDHSFNLSYFATAFRDHCKKMGINLDKPAVGQFIIQDFEQPNEFKDILDGYVEQDGELELILCIMPEKNEGYAFLKYYLEVHFAIQTQVFLEDRVRRAGGHFFTSLGLKINAKLGGTNIQFENSPFNSDDVMIVGADVNHPPQLDPDPHSIAAVVGSVDGRYVSRYIARFASEKGRSEKITEFAKLVMDLVMNFEKMNGARPRRIFIFRDGVGLQEIRMVINEELASLQTLFTSLDYHPLVTLVLVVKRHSMRLFRDNMDVNIVPKNVPAGTVVDSEIVHPTFENFYMCSHFANYGTSKPKHFYVLHDDNNLPLHELEKLCYHMCFVTAHNTSPIPLVTPVHYADLAAYRSRIHSRISKRVKSDKNQPSTESGFHNTMFFI